MEWDPHPGGVPKMCHLEMWFAAGFMVGFDLQGVFLNDSVI